MTGSKTSEAEVPLPYHISEGTSWLQARQNSMFMCDTSLCLCACVGALVRAYVCVRVGIDRSGFSPETLAGARWAWSIRRGSDITDLSLTWWEEETSASGIFDQVT